jgi:hypothetical protein
MAVSLQTLFGFGIFQDGFSTYHPHGRNTLGVVNFKSFQFPWSDQAEHVVKILMGHRKKNCELALSRLRAVPGQPCASQQSI